MWEHSIKGSGHMDHSATVSYKCPNCAAPLTYDIESGGWLCHFCDSRFDKDEIDKISQSISNEVDSLGEHDLGSQFYTDQEAMVYSCPDCGGRVITEKNTTATFCTYCHNPTVIAAKLEGDYLPEVIIPFSVSKESAIEKLKEIMKSKAFLPTNFIKYVENGEITGLYVPYWLFDGRAQFDVVGEAQRINIWSDSKYDYQKVDVYSVRRKGYADITMLPVDASQKLDDRVMDSIEPFDYDNIQKFKMQYLSGYFADSYDKGSQESFNRYQTRAQDAVKSSINQSLSNYNSKQVYEYNFSFTDQKFSYALLPVWIVSVKHKEQSYSYLINGQTGKSSGKLPLSMPKCLLTFLGVGTALTTIAMLVGYIVEAMI